MNTNTELKLQLTRDGSYTLKHPGNPEPYHSMFGAVTEAKSVFLENSEVQQRLQKHLPTTVLEIGFGSGLNFLLSAACARDNQCKLTYSAFEFLLPPTELSCELLTRNTTGCVKEIARLKETLDSGQTVNTSINAYSDLTIIRSDATKSQLPVDTFHAVYLDAFSISQNPLLWQTSFLQSLNRALKADGKLATYSVNRKFKDALTDAGFTWKKLPGPGGKREVIVATATDR